MIRQIIRGGRDQAPAPSETERSPLPWLTPPEGPWSVARSY